MRDARCCWRPTAACRLTHVPDEVGIIMDIKCPDSGMAAHNLQDNLALLKERNRRGCQDEIKFVLSSEADFHWARKRVERRNSSLTRCLSCSRRSALDSLPPPWLSCCWTTGCRFACNSSSTPCSGRTEQGASEFSKKTFSRAASSYNP